MSALYDALCDLANAHAEKVRGGLKPLILVEEVKPPIPVAGHDYRANFEGYEPGDPMGWGATREEAIADLESQQ